MVITVIPRTAFIPFLTREHDQAIRLIGGLRGYHQGEYAYPEREVRRLRRSRAYKLAAHNPYGRELWMREWGGRLCGLFGAQAPDWEPHVPVYLVTLIDRQQIVYPAGARKGYRPNPRITNIQRTYRRALRGHDYIGMLDPSLYVSTQRVEGVSRFILWHTHALVWNTSKAVLDRWADSIRPTIHAYRPYATGVDVRPVRPDGLRQLIWYIGKTPRQQYQLSRRESDTLQQYAGPINMINSVRLYAEMRKLTLPQLTMAGGEGRQIIHNTISASAAW